MREQRQSVCFIAPYRVEVIEEPLPFPEPKQVLVKTLVSAISAGTELLFYRGEVPKNIAADSTIAALSGTVRYPLRYGYACVGQVVELGTDLEKEWQDRLVFAFHPHTSHFVSPLEELIPLPPGISIEQAALLPNMETAVNLLMDGVPIIGERVGVFGQGIVGLLTTSLLARYPLQKVVTFDRLPNRRALSLNMGATAAYDPSEALPFDQSFDLAFELSGHPTALNQAIDLTGFSGRIVIGSWYGTKPSDINLGGSFHRSRIQLISSQVSTIQPKYRGRWDNQRRIDTAWAMLKEIDTTQLITQVIPVREVSQAFQMLDQQSAGVVQLLLRYE